MAVQSSEWAVPETFDITERDVVLPPPRAYAGTQPMLGILSVRALEDQATGEGHIALFAWQVMAGAYQTAAETIDRLANALDMSGLELLVVGHALAATDISGGAAFETAQRARKILKQPVTAQSIDASLLLAVTALPFGVDRVRTLLDMLGAELAAGTDEHRAVHALLLAATDPTRPLDDARAKLSALDDHFGLAQLAVVAHAREAATTKRPEVLRATLEHAAYRYEADGRPEWAARTISHALVPMLADHPQELMPLFARAVALGVQARSQYAVETVFRTASKLGFAAKVATLSQFDPPVFERRDPSAPPPPAEEPAKPKKPAAKKKKKS